MCSAGWTGGWQRVRCLFWMSFGLGEGRSSCSVQSGGSERQPDHREGNHSSSLGQTQPRVTEKNAAFAAPSRAVIFNRRSRYAFTKCGRETRRRALAESRNNSKTLNARSSSGRRDEVDQVDVTPVGRERGR